MKIIYFVHGTTYDNASTLSTGEYQIKYIVKDSNNNEITIRTQVLKQDGVLVTESAFLNKTISVVGILQPYKPENGDLSYQI